MSSSKQTPTIYSTDPLAAIMELDAKLDSCVSSLEGRLSNASSTHPNPTLEQVAADVRQLRVCMKLAIELIRFQVTQATSAVDEMENRSRRKFLLFRGIPEAEGENLPSILTDVVINKLKIKDFTTDSIRFCYRLGRDTTKAGQRPILVRFQSLDSRSRIWRSKKELKGTGVSLAEYLTAPRRAIFNEARKLYGVNKCWSQDGNVYLMTTDGRKHRLVSQVQLKEIVQKFPSAASKVLAPVAGVSAALPPPPASKQAPATRSKAKPK